MMIASISLKTSRKSWQTSLTSIYLIASRSPNLKDWIKMDKGNGTKKSQMAPNCSFKIETRGKIGKWSPMNDMAPFSIKTKTNAQKMITNSFAWGSWSKDLAWKDAIASTNSHPKQKKPSTSSSVTVEEEHSRRTRRNRIFRKGRGKNNYRDQHIKSQLSSYLSLLRPTFIQSRSSSFKATT